MYNSAIFIAFITTIIQCYNYALFGLAGADLAKYFISSTDNASAIVDFFKIFSIASFARPLGSIIFGRIADKLGRAICIKIAIFLAAISTISIGVMPSYDTIGVYAGIMLTICRMVFLISLSGEIDALRIYIYEKTGKGRRYSANGIMSFCSQIGSIVAASTYYLATINPNPEIWRMNFIIGGCISMLLLLARKYFSETEEFLDYKKQLKKIKKPYENDPGLFQIIKKNKESFFAALFVSGSVGASFHFIIIFFCRFISEMACVTDKSSAQITNVFLFVIYAISAVCSGVSADKYNPQKQIMFAIGFSIILASYVIFMIPNINDLKHITIIMLMLCCMLTFYAIPLQVMNQSIFSVDVRMRMYGLSHSLGSVFLSSTTPLMASLIWKHTESINALFGMFISILYMLTVASAVLFRQKAKNHNIS